MSVDLPRTRMARTAADAAVKMCSTRPLITSARRQERAASKGAFITAGRSSSPRVAVSHSSTSSCGRLTDNLFSPDSNLNRINKRSEARLTCRRSSHRRWTEQQLLNPKHVRFWRQGDRNTVTGGMRACACVRACVCKDECGGIKWRKPVVHELQQVRYDDHGKAIDFL